MPIGGTYITIAEADARFRRLKQIAKDRVLLVSPPYGDEGARTAFLGGYETALRDLAHGRLGNSPLSDKEPRA